MDFGIANVVELIAGYGAWLICLLGFLAFLTALIVQMVKELPGFAKVPTVLVAMAVAFILTLVAFFGGMAYLKVQVVWYMVAAAVVIAFIVWAIAEKGWSWVSELWTRFKKDAPEK